MKNIFQIIRDSQSTHADNDNIFGIAKVIKYFDGDKDIGIPEDSIEATSFINYSFSDIKENNVRGKLFLPFLTHITRGCMPGDLVLVIFNNLKNSDGYWIRPLQSIELKNLQEDKSLESNNRGIGYISIENIDKYIFDKTKLSSYSFYTKNSLFKSYALPVDGTVTLEFGIIGGFESHNGIDITPKNKDLVIAPSTCVVEKIDNDPNYGLFLILRDISDNNLKFKLAHLNDNIIVEEGQKVFKGEIIGFVGQTGKTNYKHLHLEVEYKDDIINPRPMFKGFKPVIYNKYLYSRI